MGGLGFRAYAKAQAAAPLKSGREGSTEIIVLPEGLASVGFQISFGEVRTYPESTED